MKKHIRFLPAISLLILGVFGCSLQTAPTSPSAEIMPQDLPFAGLWMSDDTTLVFTQDSMDRIYSDSEAGQVTEQLYRITSYDVARRHIVLEFAWAKRNGRFIGGEGSTFSITYQINGDQLQIGIGEADQFDSELEPIVYQRK